MSQFLYPVPRNEPGQSRRSILISSFPPPDTPLSPFLKPLRGIVQTVAAVAASVLIVVPPAPAAPVEIPTILQGKAQTIEEPRRPTMIRVPIADPEPPAPTPLRPLAGIARPDPERTPVSILIGGRFAETVTPVNVLFQRPLRGLDQAPTAVRQPAIIKVTPADVVAPIDVLFQRPLVGVVQAVTTVRPPAIVRVPVADPVVPGPTLLRPLMGIPRPTLERAPVSMLLGSRFAETAPPFPPFFLVQKPLQGRPHPPGPEYASVLTWGLEPERDVLFLTPRSGLPQAPTVVPPSRILKITPADPPVIPVDVLFQRPLIGREQAPFTVRPSAIIKVTPADVIVPINVLFQRPLRGLVQPLEEFRPSRVRTVTLADLQPPQVLRPLERVPEGFPPSRILRVQPADVVPPIDVRFQRPQRGLDQVVEVFRSSTILRVPVADLKPPQVLRAIEQLAEVFKPSRIQRVPVADPPPPPVNVLFQRPLVGLVQPPIIVRPPQLVVVPAPDPTAPFVVVLFTNETITVATFASEQLTVGEFTAEDFDVGGGV